jgi:Bacterial Ig domain
MGPKAPAANRVALFLLVAIAVLFLGAGAPAWAAGPRAGRSAKPVTPAASVKAPAKPAAKPVARAVAAAAVPTDYNAVTPCRVFDTRNPGSGGPFMGGNNAGNPRRIQVAGTCGVPANAKVVSLNVAVASFTASGYVNLYPDLSPPSDPAGSFAFSFDSSVPLPYVPAKSDIMLVSLAADGSLGAFARIPDQETLRLVLDVYGYYADSLPVAVDDAYSASKDTPLSVAAATGVTSNDTLNGGAIASYGAATGAEQATIGTATPTSAGGSVTLNANGSFSYTPPAGFLGDDTFKYIIQNSSGTSTATVTISVGKVAQTITFTSTAPAGATVGGTTYTVTATASSGLPVALTIDASASTVCSISGSTVSFTGIGTCVIDANQIGDATYATAAQVQQSLPVDKGDQTISFTSTAPAGATVGGPTYNVTATSTSGLTVALTVDASASAVCSISGSTVSFLSVGTCVIDANQAGDASYNAAPQAQQSDPVAKGDQTITFTSTAPAGAKVGGPTYTVTATASSGLPVTLTIDAAASSVCTISGSTSGSTVSFIGAGTCVIDANQAGNADYNAAPQVQQSDPVAKGDQTITFTSTAPAGAKAGGPTYTVTATASSGLPVTLTIDAAASSVCTISGSTSGSTVSFIGAGTCVIDANQAGDAS